jgi:hypothetical protein
MPVGLNGVKFRIKILLMENTIPSGKIKTAGLNLNPVLIEL